MLNHPGAEPCDAVSDYLTVLHKHRGHPDVKEVRVVAAQLVFQVGVPRLRGHYLNLDDPLIPCSLEISGYLAPTDSEAVGDLRLVEAVLVVRPGHLGEDLVLVLGMHKCAYTFDRHRRFLAAWRARRQVVPEVDVEAAVGRAPLLAARGISVHYGAAVAVDGVDLAFPPGSVTALVGDNGAGKSSLIKVLAGAIQPTTGYLELDGERVSFSSPLEARQHGIETVYQDLALAENRTITQNLFMGREKTRWWGFLRLLDSASMRKEAKAVLEDLKVRVPSVNHRIKHLSGGQRQAVAIGRAVHWGSRVLIMDEPTAALGVRESARVEELILGLKDKGLTQIVVSHNLDHVFRLATRIAVMRLGRLVAVKGIEETSRAEVVGLVSGVEVDS